MNHPIQCQCGTLKGRVTDVKTANRLVCYCRDCQAFAHFLGGRDSILDSHGGTDIVQTLPKNVSFTAGTEVLGCMQLTTTGLLRWYATCCNTPIGNTLTDCKLSFVGLVHSCLESPDTTLAASFGPVSSHVHGQSAQGEPKPKSTGTIAMIARNIARILRARLDGSYQQTPFFNVAAGTPIAPPKQLSEQDYKDLMRSIP